MTTLIGNLNSKEVREAVNKWIRTFFPVSVMSLDPVKTAQGETEYAVEVCVLRNELYEEWLAELNRSSQIAARAEKESACQQVDAETSQSPPPLPRRPSKLPRLNGHGAEVTCPVCSTPGRLDIDTPSGGEPAFGEAVWYNTDSKSWECWHCWLK